MSTSDARGGRNRGGAGCLVAFVLVLLAVGLMLLGNESRTREAMPFGLGLLPVALLVGLLSARAVARYWAAEVASEEPAAVGAASAVAPRPPAMVQCPNCGGPAPIRLSDPQASTCLYCRARFPLSGELAHALGHAAQVLHQQGQAERQLAAKVAELAAHERAWTQRLSRTTAALVALGVALAIIAVLIHDVEHDWPYYFGMGVAGAAVAAVLGGVAMSVVPPAVRAVVLRWTAIRLPGEAGLACRACGGPLPHEVRPVLRCTYCAADNLASSEVMAKVAQTARDAQRGVLSVAARRHRGDDMAAFALKFFPVVVALAWVVVALLVNPVVGAILGVIRWVIA